MPTLNLNGLHLYVLAGASRRHGITGGTVSQAPDDGGAIVPGPGIPASISKAGALDAWTFFGRAGQSVAVAVDPGQRERASTAAEFRGMSNCSIP